MSLALATRKAALAPGKWVSFPDALWRRAKAVPSLDVRFADNKSLVDAVTGQSLITFTRASSGMSTGSNGVIKTATTNLCLQSQDFSTTWTNFNSTESVNTAVAPDGTITADTLIPSNGATSGLIRQDFSGSAFTDNASISFSIFVKAAGLTNFNIQFFNKANTFYGTQTINASTGALSGSGTLATTAVTPVGDGWFRVSATGMNSGSGATGPNIRFVVTSTGDGTSGIYLWGAQLEQSSTVGEYIPTTSVINSAPRFDHNPTTGECLGLLMEEQRTNSIRNNTMVGAVAGTPGTLPTNWAFGVVGSGLTREIIGTGTENGINYIDFKISGTASSAVAIAIGVDRGAALTGQSWTGSAYFKLVGGTTAGITDWQIGLIEETGSATVTGAYYSVGTPSSTLLSRVSASRTLSGGATVANLLMRIDVTCTNGAAINFTLRIGLPQLEQGAFATSVIPTSGTAATRSADVASISGSNFSAWFNGNEGTMYGFGFVQPAGASSFSRIFSAVGSNSGTDEISMYTRVNVDPGTNGKIYGAVTVSSVLTGDIAPPTGSTAGNYVSALAYKNNDFALSNNGFGPSTDLSGGLPTCERLLLYGQARFQNIPVGYIKRFTYWPQRLSNSTLQAITQ